MRDTVKALIIISALLLAIVITGCVQNGTDSMNQNTGTPSMPAGTGAPDHGQPGTAHPQNNGITTAGPADQNQRQHAVPNATVLMQAAGKLGVSEQQLENALTSPEGIRQNLTVAARQLNLSTQQLAEALGIPSGSPVQRGARNGTMHPAGS